MCAYCNLYVKQNSIKVQENKTLFLNDKKINYKFFRTFGFLCYFDNSKRENKFSPRALKGVFLGYLVLYLRSIKGYLALDLRSNELLITRNITF